MRPDKYGRKLGIQPGTPEQADEWMAIGLQRDFLESDIAVYRAGSGRRCQAVAGAVGARLSARAIL